jgi:hypothetical protein
VELTTRELALLMLAVDNAQSDELPTSEQDDLKDLWNRLLDQHIASQTDDDRWLALNAEVASA